MTENNLPKSAERVKAAIQAKGFDYPVVILPDSARTAVLAAQALGCEVAQIAKSLIFKTKDTGRPVLVIASGSNRVDEKRVAALVGEKLGKADAEFVRSVTGFAIGGVPPVGHVQPLLTLIDEDLLQYEVIWAAAGVPEGVFPFPPSDLLPLTGGQLATVRKEPNTEG